MLNITNVIVNIVDFEKVIAFAKIVVDDCFVVHDIKIIKGLIGYIVCMPDKRFRYRCSSCTRKCDFDSNYCKYCGNEFERPLDIPFTYLDVCHPITKESREYVDKTIIAALNKALACRVQPETQPGPVQSVTEPSLTT